MVAVPGLDPGIVLATPNFRAQSENNLGGLDDPRIKSGDGDDKHGHGPEEMAGTST